jgi:MarR family transcriptional regulator, transcriptional regulator for hemolysin
MPESSPFKYAEADDSVGFLLWKITALWQKKLAQVLGAFNITQTQYAILASLRWFEENGEPTTQAHISSHAKIDKMTVSKAVRKLEKIGLVRRQSSTSDGRATNVQFTAEGRKAVAKAIEAVENADEEFFACLSEDQRAKYRCLTLAAISGNSN